MFPVRLAFSRSERLKEIIKDLIEKGKINSKDIDVENPLQFLIDEGGAESLVDAAYRFCRFENGADVILSGTGDIEHLKDNIKSFSRPPLPDDVVAKLRFMFRNVDTVSGQ
jgi:aryl-alcohol dehydrogenase-like predicted oxidoreductase